MRYAINLVAGRRTRDRFSTLDTWKHADYRLSDRVQYLSLYVRHLSGRVCSQLSDNRAWIAVLSTGSRSCRSELMYLRVAVATACEVSHRLRMDSVVEPRRCAQTPYSTGLWGLVIGKPPTRSDCAVAELWNLYGPLTSATNKPSGDFNRSSRRPLRREPGVILPVKSGC